VALLVLSAAVWIAVRLPRSAADMESVDEGGCVNGLPVSKESHPYHAIDSADSLTNVVAPTSRAP